VSHPHSDHVEGLSSIIEGMADFGREKNSLLITHPRCLEPRYALIPEQYKDYLKKLVTLDENQGIKIGDLTIIALRAEHGDVPSIGFRFVTPNCKLTYTGDTEYFDEMRKVYSDSDVIIFNLLRPDGDRLAGHLCTDDVVRIINEMETKPKLVLITHFGMKMIKSNPIMQARDIFKKTGVPVTAVNDGQKINIAEVMSQQRLINF
jgi:ribonuclease BN (tRNA processing enzyme)